MKKLKKVNNIISQLTLTKIQKWNPDFATESELHVKADRDEFQQLEIKEELGLKKEEKEINEEKETKEEKKKRRKEDIKIERKY